MEWLALLRMLGALLVVLAMLVGAMWVVRRYDLRLPMRMMGGEPGPRRLQVVERLPIDSRRAVLLIRCDETEHLLLIGPDHAAPIDRRAPAPSDAI